MPDNLSTLDFSVSGNVTVSNVATEEMPYAGDVVNITAAVTTAPTGSDLVLDVLKNGTSIFASAVATVAGSPNAQGATPAGIGVGDTKIFIEFAGNDEPDIKANETLLIDSELVLVTSTVTGSSKVDGGVPVYSVNVQRAYDGTVAAAHNQGVSVFPGKPRILQGATTSTTPNLGRLLAGTPQFVAGDVIAVNVTQVGSTVAGAGLGVTVEVSQR